MYWVTMVVRDMGWVKNDCGHSTICQVLTRQMGVWQNWLVSWSRWRNIPNQGHANPTHVPDHNCHPVLPLASESITFFCLCRINEEKCEVGM